MKHDFFQYSRGYDYEEFAAMCDRFQKVKLPLFPYDVPAVLSEYVFGYSMQRFPTGKKNVLRRFLGGMFRYPVTVTGGGNTAFLFTGDGVGRPDYLECLKAAAGQCGDASLWIMERQRPSFCIGHIFSVVQEWIWALRLNKVVKDLTVSFDLAVGLYRAKKQGEYVFRQMKKQGVQKLITFCDAWSTESVTAQLAKADGMPTATLQHGNGTEILYRSCSEYYLANSRLSRENCLKAGMPADRVIVTGPMKYAGKQFTYPDFDRVRTIGVVFDGAQNFENNVQMLSAVHGAITGMDIRCCIRFHPNNRREDYAPYLWKTDVVCDDLAKFENAIDLCVVYNSSMFTDMIFKRIPVCRFKNGKVDLFPQVQDTGFRDADTLCELLMEMAADLQGCNARQEVLYERIFGAGCRDDSYRRFFQEKM